MRTCANGLRCLHPRGPVLRGNCFSRETTETAAGRQTRISPVCKRCEQDAIAHGDDLPCGCVPVLTLSEALTATDPWYDIPAAPRERTPADWQRLIESTIEEDLRQLVAHCVWWDHGSKATVDRDAWTEFYNRYHSNYGEGCTVPRKARMISALRLLRYRRPEQRMRGYNEEVTA
jgi:hypothetical protein